jgi:LPS-assembly lipoprotein
MKRHGSLLTLLLTSLLSLSLYGCGWHLRGITPLPEDIQVMTLQSQASERFNQRLKQQLAFNGVVFPETASATVRLQVSPIKVERTVLSVNSLGQAAEYELNATLTARLIHLEKDIDTGWEIDGRRIFTNDVNNVVATASEEKTQLQELENDLIRKLMRRLQKARLSATEESL